MTRLRDPLGRAAGDVMVWALSLSGDLHVAADELPLRERGAAIVRAFTYWPSLARRVAALQDLAPRPTPAEAYAAERATPQRDRHDDVAQVAGRIARFAVRLGSEILPAMRDGPGDRLEACRAALAYWPAICRLMGELEALTPNASAQGAAAAARLQAVVERVQLAKADLAA